MTDNIMDTALRQAAACAREKYAGEEKRIDKGLVIALNGGVSMGPDDACVQSDRDPEVYYTVRQGQCECPDRSNAPDGRCKHVIAVALTIIARKAMERVCIQKT